MSLHLNTEAINTVHIQGGPKKSEPQMLYT